MPPLPDARPPARPAALLVRGAATIAAGIAALLAPPLAAKTVLAAYLGADGLFVLALAFAFRVQVRRRARILFGLDGAAGIGVAYVLFTTSPSAGLLLLIVANWAIATGVLELVASIFMPQRPALAWTVAAAGLVSCCVGVLAFDLRQLAEIGLLYLFAAYALIVGALFAIVGTLLLRAVRSER